MPTEDKATRDLCINTLRILAVDGTERAKSGHPGMPMGAAAMAFVLWHDFLHLDPTDPDWQGRDRFILSSGHASMLLYGLLHCAGCDLTIDDLKSFRQLGSKTPGHPEWGHTRFVETTTGPLGQGFANAVGMALASQMLTARLDEEGQELLGHRTFVIASDGDMQEGISYEAAALAGHLGLDKLVCIYDANDSTIEGPLSLSSSEQVGPRFEAMGWAVEEADGLDPEEFHSALSRACAVTGKPCLVIGKTRIGYGSPKEGSSACHGSPLGPEAARQAREKLGFGDAPSFHVPEQARQVWDRWRERQGQARKQWDADFEQWRQGSPDQAQQLDTLAGHLLPENLLEELIAATPADEPLSTRALSGKVLQRAAQLMPWLVGGSADLSGSNKTTIDEAGHVAAGPALAGRNLHFGIREHAMGAVANGMFLHGPWKPYCATFLVFSDYMRAPIRLAALMGLPITYVFSHDSFMVGEDGPTHQPVEHLWSLRTIPGIRVFRPADRLEVAAAWASAAQSTAVPHVLTLSRQGLPVLDRPRDFDPKLILQGGYVLSEAAGSGAPPLTIVATGSEVGFAVEVRAALAQRGGPAARIVSMPCVELFLDQSQAVQDQVLAPGSKVVVMEAGRSSLWRSVVGRQALVLGLDTFGASAKASDLREHLGWSVKQTTERLLEWL